MKIRKTIGVNSLGTIFQTLDSFEAYDFTIYSAIADQSSQSRTYVPKNGTAVPATFPASAPDMGSDMWVGRLPSHLVAINVVGVDPNRAFDITPITTGPSRELGSPGNAAKQQELTTLVDDAFVLSML